MEVCYIKETFNLILTEMITSLLSYCTCLLAAKMHYTRIAKFGTWINFSLGKIYFPLTWLLRITFFLGMRLATQHLNSWTRNWNFRIGYTLYLCRYFSSWFDNRAKLGREVTAEAWDVLTCFLIIIEWINFDLLLCSVKVNYYQNILQLFRIKVSNQSNW